MTEMDTTTTEMTALDKAQATLEGAQVMPGTEGASLIVGTETAAQVYDRVQSLTEQVTALRQEAYQARRTLSDSEDEQQSALKALVKNEVIDMDTAKEVAEALGLDPENLTSTYEVSVTVTIRVTGVVADSEDEAGEMVAENIEASLGYGVTYNSFDVDDTTVDDVTEMD